MAAAADSSHLIWPSAESSSDFFREGFLCFFLPPEGMIVDFVNVLLHLAGQRRRDFTVAGFAF